MRGLWHWEVSRDREGGSPAMGEIFYSTHCNLYYFWYPLADRRRLPVFANFKEVVLVEYQSTLEERPVATGIQTTEFASGT